MESIRFIVGLGNPGREYERTRHNAGYWWVDAIAERKRAAWKRETKFSGWTTRVEEGGREFFLLKPATYIEEVLLFRRKVLAGMLTSGRIPNLAREGPIARRIVQLESTHTNRKPPADEWIIVAQGLHRCFGMSLHSLIVWRFLGEG